MDERTEETEPEREKVALEALTGELVEEKPARSERGGEFREENDPNSFRKVPDNLLRKLDAAPSARSRCRCSKLCHTEQSPSSPPEGTGDSP